MDLQILITLHHAPLHHTHQLSPSLHVLHPSPQLSAETTPESPLKQPITKRQNHKKKTNSSGVGKITGDSLKYNLPKIWKKESCTVGQPNDPTGEMEQS